MPGEMQYVVCLFNPTAKETINLFWNSDHFFSLSGARDYIKFIERVDPRNKGHSKIFKLIEVA
jgi:hypothetical protein